MTPYNLGPGVSTLPLTSTKTGRARYYFVLTFDGETKTISEWSKVTGFRPAAIHERIWRGWSAEAILTTPYNHQIELRRTRKGNRRIIERISAVFHPSSKQRPTMEQNRC